MPRGKGARRGGRLKNKGSGRFRWKSTKKGGYLGRGLGLVCGQGTGQPGGEVRGRGVGGGGAGEGGGEWGALGWGGRA